MRQLLQEKFHSEKDDTTKTLLAILLDRDLSGAKISDGLVKHGIGLLNRKIGVSDLRGLSINDNQSHDK